MNGPFAEHLVHHRKEGAVCPSLQEGRRKASGSMKLSFHLWRLEKKICFSSSLIFVFPGKGKVLSDKRSLL